MKKTKTKILNKNQLSNLVARFSKSYVIEEMERSIKQAKSTELEIKNIDDNSIIKSAPIPNEILKNVADSIVKSGLTNPLIVRPKKDYYEIVFGRKRLLACKKYKPLVKVPVFIINVTDEEMLFMLLADNREQREANIIETALILKEMSEKHHYNQQTLADIAHQSRSQITNILRILNLPKNVIDDISLNKLSYGHARALVSLPEDSINELASRIHQENLSVREVEKIVKEQRKGNDKNDLRVLNKYFCTITNSDTSLIIKFKSIADKNNFLKDIKK